MSKEWLLLIPIRGQSSFLQPFDLKIMSSYKNCAFFRCFRYVMDYLTDIHPRQSRSCFVNNENHQRWMKIRYAKWNSLWEWNKLRHHGGGLRLRWRLWRAKATTMRPAQLIVLLMMCRVRTWLLGLRKNYLYEMSDVIALIAGLDALYKQNN